MCIRDRRVRGRPGAAVSRDRGREERRVDVHDPRARLLGEGCLLYTSDAADERSSVDFGGRRIIKKKKHVRE